MQSESLPDGSSLPEEKGTDVHTDGSSLQKEKARPEEKRDAAMILGRAKSDRRRKLAASQQSPYAGNTTARAIMQQYPGYHPFAPNNKDKLKELATWLQECP